MNNGLIDLEFLKDFCSNDVSFIKEMLKLFSEGVPDDLESAEKAILDENWKVGYRFVHSIKSSSKFMGVKELASLQKELEKAFNGEDKSQIEPLFINYKEIALNAVANAKQILANL